MVDPIRVLAYGAFFGSMVAWSVVAPERMSAVAEEPVKAATAAIDTLFPPSVDPNIFRKYDLVFDESISTDVKRTQIVTKIGAGRSTEVTIVTTPSGIYSTDGLLSPHVRYPGIEKKLKWWGGNRTWSYSSRSSDGGSWTSFSNGSFTYYTYRVSTRT